MRFKVYLPIFLSTITLCLTLFFFAPFNTFFKNINEYNFLFPTAFSTLLGLSLVVVLLLNSMLLAAMVIAKIAHKGHIKVLFLTVTATIVTVLAFMFWLQGNIIAPDVGVLDGRRIFWRQFVIPVLINFTVWVIVLGILVRYRSRLFRFLVPVCLILLAMQTANFSVQYLTKPEPPNFKLYTNDSIKQHSLYADKNLVIIVLDTFQSDIFEEVIMQNPEIVDKLNGFTYYPDTAGGYPNTSLSIPLIMTGKFYLNQKPFRDFEKETYLTSSVLKDLNSYGFDVLVPCTKVLYCSDQFSDSVVRRPIEGWLNKTQLSDLFFPTIIRSVPTVTYFGFQKVRYHLDLLVDRDLMGADDSPRQFKRDNQLLKSILTETTTDNTRPAFRFYHFTAPHLPFYLGNAGEFQKQTNNRQGQVNHSAGALSFAIEILDRYKELGVYDQTMIVIMADHGFGPLGYRTTPEDTITNNEIYASAMPLLLVKPFNSHEPLVIDNVPTTFESIGQDLLNYLEESESAPTTKFIPSTSSVRHFYFYKNSDERKILYFPEMQHYIITGPIREESSWQRE